MAEIDPDTPEGMLINAARLIGIAQETMGLSLPQLSATFKVAAASCSEADSHLFFLSLRAKFRRDNGL